MEVQFLGILTQTVEHFPVLAGIAEPINVFAAIQNEINEVRSCSFLPGRLLLIPLPAHE